MGKKFAKKVFRQKISKNKIFQKKCEKKNFWKNLQKNFVEKSFRKNFCKKIYEKVPILVEMGWDGLKLEENEIFLLEWVEVYWNELKWDGSGNLRNK